MDQKPSIGRIVHYYEGDWEAPDGYPKDASWRGTNGTRWHPAIITRVFSEGCVNLQIFFDAAPARVKTSMGRLPAEVFADGMHCTNSGWVWPERV